MKKYFKYEMALQRGQGLVEYAIIAVVVLIVGYVVLRVGWSWLEKNVFDRGGSNVGIEALPENITGTRIPVSLTQAPISSQDVELGEIIVTNEELTDIVAVDSIELPNCNGSRDLTITRSLNREITRHVSIRVDAEANFTLPMNIAEAEIKAFYNVEDNNSISESIDVEMSAAPGTTVTYEVEWVEISKAGVIEVIVGEDRYFQEFTMSDSLEANIRQPTQEPCLNSTPTP